MSNPLGDIGIAEGDETPLQEIIAPEEGEDYSTSYYQILRAIEQNTVYIEESQAALPNAGDFEDEEWPLVGIAATETDEFEGDSVHIYDDESGEWVDTLESVEDFVQKLDEYIGDVDVENDGDLQTQITDNEDDISDNADAIAENEDDISDNADAIAENEDDISHNADAIAENEGDISDNADAIAENEDDISHNADAIAENEGDISDNADAIAENEERISENEDAIGDVDDDLQTQIDDLDENIGDVDVDNDGDLQTQVNDLDAEDISADGFDEFDDLEELLNNLDDIIDELDAKDISVDDFDEFDDLEELLNNLDHAISSIEIGDVESLQDELDDIDEKLDKVEDKIDELSEDLFGAAFIPTIADVTSEIVVGETAQIEVDILNSGRDSATQPVTLSINGDEIETSSIELEINETESIIYEWTPTEDDLGDIEITVETESGSHSKSTTVLRPAEFHVTSVETPDDVVMDQTATITPTIENKGEVADTQQVDVIYAETNGTAWSVDEVSDDVSLDPGESKEIEYEWVPKEVDHAWEIPDPGAVEVTVKPEDDGDSSTNSFDLTVPSEFEDPVIHIKELDTDGSNNREADYRIIFDMGMISTGDSVYMEATTGSTEWSATLEEYEYHRVLRDNNSGVANLETIEFKFYESREKNFLLAETSRSANRSGTERILGQEDLQPATFHITELEVPNQVTMDETVTITSTIENRGDVSGTQQVDVEYVEPDSSSQSIDEDSDEITLYPGESGEIEYEWVPTEVDYAWELPNPGPVEVTARPKGDGDTSTDSFELTVPSEFEEPVIHIKSLNTDGANNREASYRISFDMGMISTGDSVYMEATTGSTEWSSTLNEFESHSVSRDNNSGVASLETIEFKFYDSDEKNFLLAETTRSANRSGTERILGQEEPIVYFKNINTSSANIPQHDHRIDFEMGVVSPDDGVYLEATTGSANWETTLEEYESQSTTQSSSVRHNATIDIYVYESSQKQERLGHTSVPANRSTNSDILIN